MNPAAIAPPYSLVKLLLNTVAENSTKDKLLTFGVNMAAPQSALL